MLKVWLGRMRNGRDWRKDQAWRVLEEMGGQEPLIHDLQVLLHLAGCRSEGSLNAHKGNTDGWGMGEW